MQGQASALPFSCCRAQTCHGAIAVTSSLHSPSPPRLTAQGAGLPGHLLLPAGQWLPKECPGSSAPCPISCQGSQAWDALWRALHNLQSTLGSKWWGSPSASFSAVFGGTMGVQGGFPAVSSAVGFLFAQHLRAGSPTGPCASVVAVRGSKGWIEAALQPAGAEQECGSQACTVVQPECWMWIVSC